MAQQVWPKPPIMMKQGANSSLQGSTVSSRQHDEGIIFSSFVQGELNPQKYEWVKHLLSDDEWFLDKQHWKKTNSLQRKRPKKQKSGLWCSPGIQQVTACASTHSQLSSLIVVDGAEPPLAWHGVCIYQTRTLTGNNTWKCKHVAEHSWEIHNAERGKKNLQNKTIKLHHHTNQHCLRRAGIGNSEGPEQQPFYVMFM